MADSKVSDLAAVTGIGATDELYVVVGGVSKKVSNLTVADGAVISGTNTGDQDLSGLVPVTRTVNGQALSGDVTITTITGNAGTATALATPRNINGVAFDGTANITVTAAAGTLSGATLAAGVTASSLTSFGNSPTLVTPDLGTPSALTLTNATGLPIAGIAATGTPDNTTYLRGDGTWATAGGGGGATTALDNLASVAINAALVLGTSDAFALGSATKMWSDLFLASGAVINFNNGDVTITHASNLLTIGGGGHLAFGTADGSAFVDIAGATDTVQGLRIEGNAFDALGFSAYVTGDAQVRFTVRTDGMHLWGDGTTTTDTNLYRSAANTLKTDDAFVATGTITGSNLSGTNTGDQTITLTGDVTGSGTGSFATTIAAGAVTNAMLAGSIAISKLSITGTPDGTKFLRDDGSWQAAGGAGLSWGASISGTTPDGLTLTVSNSASANVTGLNITVGNTQANADVGGAEILIGTSGAAYGLRIIGTSSTATTDEDKAFIVHLNTASNTNRAISVGNETTFTERFFVNGSGFTTIAPVSGNGLKIGYTGATNAGLNGNAFEIDTGGMDNSNNPIFKITGAGGLTSPLAIIDANVTATGSVQAIGGSGTPLFKFYSSRTNTSTSGSKTDTYDFAHVRRTSVQNGAGGTFVQTGSVLTIENAATQTAGTLTDSVVVSKLVQSAASTGAILETYLGATKHFYVTNGGLPGWIAADTQATVGSAGSATALPAQPTGYAKIDVTGVGTVVVPYYAAA